MSGQPVQITNEMIHASAGAGKTYQLVNRYIRLLLCGQAPERIIALTFTRKAAGEFFAGILKKLAEAAQDAEKAELLSNEIQMAEATTADFSVALRRLLNNMPQLALGTIDGFFNRVLGMFSLEYGLSGEFEIMDDFSAEQARLQVMEQLFAAEGARPEDREALIKSYQLVSAGKQDRRFYETFESYLRECHNLFHRNPRAEFWGAERKIWAQGNSWSEANQNKSDLIDEFRAELEAQSGFNGRLQTAWAKIVEHLEQWEPGKDLLGAGGILLKSALASIANLDILGVTPFWQFYQENQTPFFGRFVDKVVALAETYGLEAQVWLQGFLVPAGSENELALAADIAARKGVHNLAVWGFKGSSYMSFLRSEEPETIWNMIGKLFQGFAIGK